MAAYYNEFDPKAAAWLRELIKGGLIANGEVDERSIVDVSASDLRGYSQHHFFAGIGGWSYALRLAGWPDDKPVFTASLPCQPFSAAGKGLGKSDERHLLPHFLNLVKECKPSVIFGEQVSAAIKHGWLDDLYAEMEACDYAVGSIIIGAHSVNSPHIRQRLYWVADSVGDKRESKPNQRSARLLRATIQQEKQISGFSDMGATFGSMADSQRTRLERFSGNGNDCDQPKWINPEQSGSASETGIVGCGIAYPNSIGCHGWSKKSEQKKRICSGIDISGDDDDERMGISDSPGSQQRIETTETARYGNPFISTGSDDIQWIYCRDNKYRPIESSIKPLVDGIPRGMVYSGDPCESVNQTQEARAMRLRGYGNAIVPQLAAKFIGAFADYSLI